MTIVLDQKESEKFFHNALCNGMSELGYCELDFDCLKKDYEKARITLNNKLKKKEFPHEMYIYKGHEPSACREDVWMEILRNGGKLKIIDLDGGTNTKKIGLAEVHERVQKADKQWLIQMEDGTDDATTAFEILQMVFFEESIYG